MSSLLSRKKRTGETSNTPVSYNPNPNPNPNPNSSNNSKSAGLTLPQVINVIDNRLIVLESFMKESKQNPVQSPIIMSSSNIDETISNDFMNEIQSRYEILAQEISELKDIILKLQTYTMDVNKTLLEERIHILSDLGDVEKNDTSLVIESNDV